MVWEDIARSIDGARYLDGHLEWDQRSSAVGFYFCWVVERIAPEDQTVSLVGWQSHPSAVVKAGLKHDLRLLVVVT